MITSRDKAILRARSLGKRVVSLRFRDSRKTQTAPSLPERLEWALPLDIFREIANHSSQTEVWCLSKTSRELRALLLPEIYAEVSLDCGSRRCSGVLDMLSKSPHLWIHIRSLIFEPEWLSYPIKPALERSIIAKLQIMLPHLRRLHTFHWAGIQQFPDTAWAVLRTSCPELRRLCYGTEVATFSPQSELFKFRHLVQFWITVREPGGALSTSSTKFPVEFCDMLLENPDLESIMISAAGKTLGAMPQVLHGRWSKLHRLSIELSPLVTPQASPEQLTTFISSHPSLTTLGLYFPTPAFTIDQTALPLLKSFTGVSEHLRALPSIHLSELVLHDVDTAETFAPTVAALHRFPTLRCLQIQLADARPISKLRDIVSACPCLTTLDLSYIMAFDTKQLKAVSAALTGLPFLSRLTLTKTYHIADGTMLNTALLLLAHNRGLRDIHLHFLTAKGWKQSGDYNTVSTRGGKTVIAKEYGSNAVGASFMRRFRYEVEETSGVRKRLARIRL
ncbi:hypothetical protein C8R46DRAFT_1099015 [Mycena filopes]|nr:hypothetical protein C8R46DRAFT_1099015 [Mycena filopes]